MRFKRIYIVVVLFFTICFGFITLAADSFRLTESAKRVGFTDNAKFSSIPSIVSLAVNLTLSLLAIIFFGMMCYGGFRWLTAQGEDDKIDKAKTAIRAAIIGMVIVVSSYALTVFIFNAVGITTTAGYCTVQYTESGKSADCFKIDEKSCSAYSAKVTETGSGILSASYSSTADTVDCLPKCTNDVDCTGDDEHCVLGRCQ